MTEWGQRRAGILRKEDMSYLLLGSQHCFDKAVAQHHGRPDHERGARGSVVSYFNEAAASTRGQRDPCRGHVAGLTRASMRLRQSAAAI